MTQEDLPKDEKAIQTLEEICENTRAIRREEVVPLVVGIHAVGDGFIV
jgi:hypothetical protein